MNIFKYVKHAFEYVYIYIYIKTEREREIHGCRHIFIHNSTMNAARGPARLLLRQDQLARRHSRGATSAVTQTSLDLVLCFFCLSAAFERFMGGTFFPICSNLRIIEPIIDFML